SLAPLDRAGVGARGLHQRRGADPGGRGGRVPDGARAGRRAGARRRGGAPPLVPAPRRGAVRAPGARVVDALRVPPRRGGVALRPSAAMEARRLVELALEPAFFATMWSGRPDSNRRRQPWQGCTLPLSYSRNSE